MTRIYAEKLRTELKAAVDTRKLAEAWAALHPKDFASKALDPALSAFLARAGQAIMAALRKVLPSAWTEGWALGQQSAVASALSAASADLPAVNWGEWTPGDVEAASQVAGSGLRDLLASQEVNIKSIAGSRLEELGDILAAHLSSPETERPLLPEEVPPMYSVDSLADALEGVLDNPERAVMVAHTELARASQTAASWVFSHLGVALVRVSTAGDRRVCPACASAESAGAQPVGTYTVPLHPLCRCATVAAVPPLSSLSSLPGVPDSAMPDLAGEAEAGEAGAGEAAGEAEEAEDVPEGHWPLSRVGKLQSGNEPGMTVEQEYQDKEVQGNYSPNDYDRAAVYGQHPRDYQAGITSHIAEHGIINPAQTSYGVLDEGYHRYAAARQLGLASMPVRESGQAGAS